MSGLLGGLASKLTKTYEPENIPDGNDLEIN